MRIIYFVHGLFIGIFLLLWSSLMLAFETVYFYVCFALSYGVAAYKKKMWIGKVDIDFLEAELEKLINADDK